MSTGVLQEVAGELRDDGDEVEVGAWTLRLTIEPDPDMSIMDEQGEGVWCGRLEYAVQHPYVYGAYIRPEWADGGAELLRPTRGHDAIWWRPLDDCLRDRELRDRVRATVCDLLDYGYVGAVVEAWRHTDLYGRGCVEAVASLWGMDEVYPEAVEGLVAEVLEQIGEQS